MSRYDLQTPPTKRRPQTLSALAWVGAFMCAALVGTLSPASADTFSHLPSVDLFPTLSFATGNDEYGSPGGPDPLNNYGPPIGNIQSPSAGNASGGLRSGVLDLDLAVTIPILRGLSAQYVHNRGGGIDTTIGRVTGSVTTGVVLPNGSVVGGGRLPTNQYIYPASNNDIKDTFQLNYSGIKGIGVSVGTFYRFRHDNPATADAATNGGTPADWHEQFVSLSYTSPAFAALNGATVGISGTYNYNKHHVSAIGLLEEEEAGFSDSDGKIRTGVNYGVNANLPFNHGFNLFGSASYGAFDFFDNSPVPFYYDIIDVGINKRFNQVFSLTADLNNLTQQNLGGWPFISPNTIHRIYFAITGDVHI